MLRKKATCWHAYLKAKRNANWESYRCARNRCTSLKRSAMKVYFDDSQGDTNGKMFWQTIRPFLGHSAVTYEIGVPTGFPVKLAITKIGGKCTLFVRVKTAVVAL